MLLTWSHFIAFVWYCVHIVCVCVFPQGVHVARVCACLCMQVLLLLSFTNKSHISGWEITTRFIILVCVP